MAVKKVVGCRGDLSLVGFVKVVSTAVLKVANMVSNPANILAVKKVDCLASGTGYLHLVSTAGLY